MHQRSGTNAVHAACAPSSVTVRRTKPVHAAASPGPIGPANRAPFRSTYESTQRSVAAGRPGPMGQRAERAVRSAESGTDQSFDQKLIHAEPNPGSVRKNSDARRSSVGTGRNRFQPNSCVRRCSSGPNRGSVRHGLRSSRTFNASHAPDFSHSQPPFRASHAPDFSHSQPPFRASHAPDFSRSRPPFRKSENGKAWMVATFRKRGN